MALQRDRPLGDPASDPYVERGAIAPRNASNTRSDHQLRQRVSVDCDGTAFAAAAKQLAADTGANVVVDPRLGDKANKAVTLKLDDVPLETAVRLLAEVADLRAVRMSNVLFVTTPEKAKALRKDGDAPTSPSPLNPFFPGGGVPVPGVIGGPAGEIHGGSNAVSSERADHRGPRPDPEHGGRGRGGRRDRDPGRRPGGGRA